jgi:hypothetical protein
VKIAVVAIALLGFAAGLVFRVHVLIAFAVFLLFLSIGYNIAHQFGVLTSVLTIIGVQVIAQGSYFLGLVARSIAGRGRT